MISDPAAVRFRLSASQMSVIWPGLDRLVKCCSVPKGQASLNTFPVHLYALPSRFDRGTYSEELMTVIRELYKRLRPQSRTGGRVQMHTIEIRAAIFAIRVKLDWRRSQKHIRRKYSDRAKQVLGVDPKSLATRKKKAAKVIRSLERQMKRANDRFVTEAGREAYDAVTSSWRGHIRWIRLNRTYFKPRKLGNSPSKKLYQTIIDDLQRVAEVAIAEEGFAVPAPDELRHAIRLFAVSCRRGRQGFFNIARTLNASEYAKWNLFEFLEKRLELEPLKK